MSRQNVAGLLFGAALVAGLALFVGACQKKTEPPATTVEPAMDSLLIAGQRAYLANCAMCHGESGAGDGPLAAELRERSGASPATLNDRTRLASLGHSGLVRVITQGGAHTGRSNLMPPWGEKLGPVLIDHIADFLMKLPDLKPGIPPETIESYLSAPAGSAPEGRRLFVFYCSACHGPQAHGDGTFADTLWARNQIRPRNLTDSVYFAKKTDQELYATVSLGGGHMGKSVYMPAWGVSLRPEQIKDLLSYIRAISRTGTTPAPTP